MKISQQELDRIIKEEMEAAIDEGVWDTIKYGLSKLGSLEKGGKLAWRPGMTKDEKAAAQKITGLLDKGSNALIKDLDVALKQNFKGFPNMQENSVFVDALSEIFAVYAGLKIAVEKNELPCPEANVIIDDLNNYARYILDYKLSDVYKHFREEQEKDGILLEKGADDEGGTFGGAAGKSTTIKGLKSRLAPAILALGGATAALGSVLLQQPWFVNLVTGGGAGAPKTISKVLDVQSGEGPTQMLGRILHGNGSHYNPNVPLGDMLKDMSANGVKPSDLAKLGANPTKWLSNWNSITGAPGAAGKTMAQVFGAAPKQGLLWHPTLKGAGIKVSKAVAGSAAGGVSAATLGAVATQLLAPLGISLALSAGAVMFLRKKGEKSSRAQLLQALLDEMSPLECETVGTPEPPVTPEPPEKPYEFP